MRKGVIAVTVLVVVGGLSAVLYCFIWLYFSAAGPGPWSVDARRKR